MPSPVFLWERAYGGAHGLRPYKVFRRAACPHTAAKGGQGPSAPTDGFGDGATGPMWGAS